MRRRGRSLIAPAILAVVAAAYLLVAWFVPNWAANSPWKGEELRGSLGVPEVEALPEVVSVYGELGELWVVADVTAERATTLCAELDAGQEHGVTVEYGEWFWEVAHCGAPSHWAGG